MTISDIYRLGRTTSVAVLLLAGGEAQAQWGRRNCPPTNCPAPWASVPAPGASAAQQGPGNQSLQSAPAETSKPAEPPAKLVAPSNPDANSKTPPAATPNLTDQIGNAANNMNMPSSFAAAASPQNLAPNMIGDFFAGKGNTIEIPTFRPGVFDGATGRANWSFGFINQVTQGSPIEVQGFSDAATLQIRLANGSTPPGFQPSYSLIQLGLTSDVVANSVANFAPGTVGTTFALNPNAPVVTQVYQIAKTLIVAGETAGLKPGETLDAVNVTVNNGTATRSQGRGDPFPEESVSIQFDGSAQTSIRSVQTILVDVPSPSGGGIFGRLKLSENNSPMPRDRVFFDYSYFSDVPIANNGAHVQVFRPGFEKTFFNETASVEVRTPFAATLDSNQTSDGAMAYNAEFGNITVGGKALLYSNGTWAFSFGTALIIPTADDIKISSTLLGRQLIQVNNQAYHVQPYLAALWTPSERFFLQTFVQIDFCLNGNAVFTDVSGAGLVKSGHLNDQTNFFWDVGMGYWLFRNTEGESLLRGLAPVFELHYNQSLNDADIVQFGDLGIGDLGGNYSIINATMGLNIDLRTNTSMMLGVVLPLTTDRQFNYELSLQLNQRLGGGGRAPYTSPDF